MSSRLAEQLALLPEYLGNHMILTLCALAIGISISIPVALLATRVGWLEWPVLTFAGVMQTVPALALLALMVPLLGRIGFTPALAGLVLYSMFPVLRNTVTGIKGVDPAFVEAGRAIGMTDQQLLWRVQVPLAAPVIVAGIRIASVWVVGIATLSTPVGSPSLGNYIFSGLQTQNFTAVLVGVVAAAALAVVLDLLIRLIEVAVSRRNLALGLTGALGLALLAIPALVPMLPRAEGRLAGRSVVIGAKTFTEQYIIAEVLKRRANDSGYRASNLQSLGSTVVFDALKASRIDCYVDYSGTIWANHMKRRDQPGRESVLQIMSDWLLKKHGIICLGSLGFENAYALAMRKDRASSLGIQTVSDLGPRTPTLSIGGDYEFFVRPEWQALREQYRLKFAAKRSFDPTLMYPAVQRGVVDVISAFTTDGRIPAFGLVLLRDDREVLPPYDAVLLLSPAAARHTGLKMAFEPLIGAITDEEMRQANMLVDLKKASVSQAANWLYAQLEEGKKP
ncbi:MAG: ABC transporter permease subunit [Acidobacteria bacterium]|nr:MAG: ABC transporter permease subunit [Acidobacteriota bacterium]